jgi:heavy metal translocating P-type ATPase
LAPDPACQHGHEHHHDHAHTPGHVPGLLPLDRLPDQAVAPATAASCGHHHGDVTLLSGRERWMLASRLVTALVAVGLLLLAALLRTLRADGQELSRWVDALAALLVGVPVLREAWRSLRTPGLHGTTDILVAIALMAAWVTGDLETAALVPLAMVIGHAIEERSLLGSQEALAALTLLTRGHARLMGGDGTITQTDGEALRMGDRIELRPGDRCPVDGVVEEGDSSLDTAPVTGESVPMEVHRGDHVLAGAVNLAGRVVVRVARTGGATALGRVVALMQDAERSKPAITRLLDRFAGGYLMLVVLSAVLLGVASGSTTVMMATLVAACPCALVVAAPATAVAAIAAAARRGILVKNTAFLERLSSCDSVIFDKTGTLTEGSLTVLDAVDDQCAPLIAALGRQSSHPAARACGLLAGPGGLPPVQDLREQFGHGLSAQVDGQRVLLGRASFLGDHGVTVPPAPDHDGPVVGVAFGDRFIAWLRLADAARPEAGAALDELRVLGLTRQMLCTGDRQVVADRIAAGLGLTEVEAEALPATKLARVHAEIRAGRQPLVVGDGVNDSLALKAGAVGIAVGGARSDVAAASADLVLIDGNLHRLGMAVRLSHACRSTILVSIVIACVWTAAIVAFAAAGVVSPVLAAVLHNIGTIAVIANAGRLIAAPVGWSGRPRGRDAQ